MQKAEVAAIRFGELGPVSAGLIEQNESPMHIGTNKCVRRSNGAVDVALGGEVDNGTGPVIAQQGTNQVGIVDIATDQPVAWVAVDRGQAGGVARVGKQIEIDHGSGLACQPAQYEV